MLCAGNRNDISKQSLTLSCHKSFVHQGAIMEGNPVSVIDIRIPFWRLVAFFVKASIAVIPAAIIVAVIYFLIVAVFAAMVGIGRF